MPETIELGILKVEGVGGILVEDAADVLMRIHNAYNSIAHFDYLVFRVEEAAREWGPMIGRRGRFNPFLAEVLNQGSLVLTRLPVRAEPLILHKVRLESPGIWEFLGALNLLDTIRKWMNDRHERMKDDKWRDDAQRRKAELENLQLENEVVRGRIQVLKDAGFSDEEVRALVVQYVGDPLREIGTLQERRIVSKAEIVEPDLKQLG